MGTATILSKRQQRLSDINELLSEIVEKAKNLEQIYAAYLYNVHIVHKESARNLVHYLALRTYDLRKINKELRECNLPEIVAVEAHVMHSLSNIKIHLDNMMGQKNQALEKIPLNFKKSDTYRRKKSKKIFGFKSKRRFTRIMVTLPSTAAQDLGFVKKLLKNGMNCARINCAHDNPEVWGQMIENLKLASQSQRKKCKVMMDLGGPKLRTGPVAEGYKVVHIRPERDDFGRITKPAMVWLANSEDGHFGGNGLIKIPFDNHLLSRLKRGDKLRFRDTRGKKCTIEVEEKKEKGRIGLCWESAYIATGTEILLEREKKKGKKKHVVGEIMPTERCITLKVGDSLILHKKKIEGEPTVYDDKGKVIKKAHISCTLPRIFDEVQKGEPIFFDDGKIEGVISKVLKEQLEITISHAKENGGKLKADKGINLPDTNLTISGLTEKDKTDLAFVAKHADSVNMSFVNTEKDVFDLLSELKSHESTMGIILKIETQKGFENLPSILLSAMRSETIGVMIARGDLAIETGWKNFATIQQEIMRICAAAQIPTVWATQVLENLAKKGTPSRSEITDAALAQQTECVMLNKGRYIHKAVKILDGILSRMENFQEKDIKRLPKMELADKLVLSHDEYNVP